VTSRTAMRAHEIEKLLATYLANERDARLLTVAKMAGALPLVADIGGVALLRPDGEIVSMGWDSDHPPTPETDEAMRLYALVAGSEKYPELKALLPARPTGATDCPQCRGNGRVTIGSISAICGRCSGIGWIPELAGAGGSVTRG
jgi:hypothetical protein